MDFSLTEERRMLQDTLTRFLGKEYSIAARSKAAASDLGYDAEIWAKLAELGVFAALFAEDQGGFGGTGFDNALVFEAMGKALVMEPLVESIVLAGGALAASANPDHAAYLALVLEGRKRPAFAHYEDGGRYDPRYVTTVCSNTGEAWILNGQKSMVRCCEGADTLVVSARSSDGGDDDWGRTALFLVPTDVVGVAIRGYRSIDGARCADVTLTDVNLPKDAVIAAVGEAPAILERIIGQATLAVCAEALGIMDTIKTLTIEYLQTRKQFGVVIGQFQALQHRMAEVLVEIEQTKSAVINAAAALDGDSPERERILSATKYTIGQVGARVAEEAIQMHGGIGMTWEYDLGHFAKRLILIDHEFGDEDYHLQRFIDLGRSSTG